MATYNAYENRKVAFKEARSTSCLNLFPITRSKSEPPRTQWQAGNELEKQPVILDGPSASRPSDASSAKEQDAVVEDSRPDTGIASTSHLQPNESQDSATASATEFQGTLRQRNSALEHSQETGAAGEGRQGNPEEEKKTKTLFKHIEPKEPFTVRNQLQRTFLNSWLNILLLAAPVGIAINYVHSVSRIAVFVVNFIAIIPLAAMLGFATEEIALRTGETLGGLLNATFGNAVELIVAIIALAHDEVIIVQTSLIGSILSNLLLVLGLCFFFGGIRRQEQYFNTTVAQTAASLLALAVASVIVPTVFDIASDTPQSDIAKLSRGTSVILLIVYGGYLFFQLKTHSKVFAEESQKVEAKPFKRNLLGSNDSANGPESAIARGLMSPAGMIMVGHGGQPSEAERLRRLLANPPRKNLRDCAEGVAAAQPSRTEFGAVDENDSEEPQLQFGVAVATLTVSTVVIALCAEYMVDSISSVTSGGRVSAEFVGLILLPIVGNAAEHATAVTVAMKDKMDLAIGVAVGSSMQVALFIIPLLVIIGWGMGVDAMALNFDPFQVAVMFVSVLLVNYLIADGKSHWLEGMLLICLYAIIAVCSWWYPAHDSLGPHSG